MAHDRPISPATSKLVLDYVLTSGMREGYCDLRCLQLHGSFGVRVPRLQFGQPGLHQGRNEVFQAALETCGFKADELIGLLTNIVKPEKLRCGEIMQAPITDGIVSSPYPPVDLLENESLYQHIKKRFSELGDQPALIRNGESLSFAAVLSLTERYAKGFQQHGISCGSRVCVSVSNSAESLLASYSLCCLGATVILGSPVLTEHHSPDFVCVQDFEGEDGGQFEEPRIEDTKNHIMLCVYTSGTTGIPKGAEISMYAFIAAAEVNR
ncbi:hypothetical protein HPB50_009427 [Hyalomma asiaticum]|uniref:Uncharacterized protein n=1 Tax=Hyalomma asiaticum TaxID=266040 RepID=A0ACB7RQF6_HYAAI|nr:hypothetical protein HPB50_009427 [Hyalomma asiaticum]